MAVFTPVALADLDPWMNQFLIGKAISIRGIQSGIENSNFFLRTDQDEYVLTLFEVLTHEQLPFYLHLMRHLSLRGVPVPAPIANMDGEILHTMHGKPTAIVTKLIGESNLAPEVVHCKAVGTMLARMHLAGRDFDMFQPNLRGIEWWRKTAPLVMPFLDAATATLLADEMISQEAFAASSDYTSLPRGPIHADLFRNNVMFDGEHLSGFFDFYFAGCDTWLFDLAVTVNDWCIDLTTGVLDMARANGLLDAYNTERALSEAERRSWPMMLRAAALRFWLSRLYDFHRPREAEMLKPHDPTHFERILRLRKDDPMVIA